jgi:hypothetical protein
MMLAHIAPAGQPSPMNTLSLAFVVNGILGIVAVVVIAVAFEVRKRR